MVRQARIRLVEIIRYFLYLGSVGFGGSIALAHRMYVDVVEKRAWLSHDQFTHGLMLSQLTPGPLAAQLAIYIGFVLRGVAGATIAIVCFLLPSFSLTVVLAIAYTHVGQSLIIQHIFSMMGAAIIGIIVHSGASLTMKTMWKRRLLIAIYIVSVIVILWTKSVQISIFVAAGVFSMLVYTQKKRIPIPKVWIGILPNFKSVMPFAIGAFSGLLPFFLFFLKAGSVSFGGGFSVIAYLQHGVVNEYHWLTSAQFSDAIAIAMITPGPLAIVASFIGYLVAGIPGAFIATLAIFLPVYLIVLVLTPFFTTHAKNPQLGAFAEGVIAASMASVAASILLLAQTEITDIYAAGIAILSFIASKFFRIPSILIVLCAGILGLLLQMVV